MEVKANGLDAIDIWTVQEIQQIQNTFAKKLFNFGELNFLNVKIVKLIPNPSYYFELINKVKITGKGEPEKVKEQIPEIKATTPQTPPEKTT